MAETLSSKCKGVLDCFTVKPLFNDKTREEKKVDAIRPQTRRGKRSDSLEFIRNAEKHGVEKAQPLADCLLEYLTNAKKWHIFKAVFPEKDTCVILFTDASRAVIQRNKRFYKFSWIRRSGKAFFSSVWSYSAKDMGDERLF